MGNGYPTESLGALREADFLLEAPSLLQLMRWNQHGCGQVLNMKPEEILGMLEQGV